MTADKPRPIMLLLSLVEDTAPGAGHNEIQCANCQRPCWLPAFASERFEPAGFAKVICSRCLIDGRIDGAVDETPAHNAELISWRRAFDHEHQPHDMTHDTSPDTRRRGTR